MTAEIVFAVVAMLGILAAWDARRRELASRAEERRAALAAAEAQRPALDVVKLEGRVAELERRHRVADGFERGIGN